MNDLKSNINLTHKGEKMELTVHFSIEPVGQLKEVLYDFCKKKKTKVFSPVKIQIERIVNEYEIEKSDELKKMVKIRLRRMFASVGNSCSDHTCFHLRCEKMAEVFPV